MLTQRCRTIVSLAALALAAVTARVVVRRALVP